MVALAHSDGRRRHLRLVTPDEAARRRQHELVIMRRRAAAVGLIVALLVGLGVLLGRTSGHAGAVGAAGAVGTFSAEAGSVGSAESGGAVHGGAGADTVLPVAERAYVVQSGDTLWRIARALQPEGDVRPLVMELQRARKGAPLRVGERITLP